MAVKSLVSKVGLAERVAKAGGVAKVAAAAGLSKGYITHICAGRRSPSIDTLAALAVSLKIGMGVVLAEVEQARAGSRAASVNDERTKLANIFRE